MGRWLPYIWTAIAGALLVWAYRAYELQSPVFDFLIIGILAVGVALVTMDEISRVRNGDR